MGLIRLFKSNKPKIKISENKSDKFSGWIKCQSCLELFHQDQLKETLSCCPKCSYHYKISVTERLALLIDSGSFNELNAHLSSKDPLDFFDSESYKEKILKTQKATHQKEAVLTGIGQIDKLPVAIAIMNYAFMGGSMGACVGEKITRLIEKATEEKLPLIIVSNSGGARMQESIFSLMQMAKISSALMMYHERGGFYVSLLTNPTMGGVTASFAMLGDVIVAEPKALIGFAGPRVIEQTMRQKLPEGAQTSEFLLEKGMIDLISSRSELKKTISKLVHFFNKS